MGACNTPLPPWLLGLRVPVSRILKLTFPPFFAVPIYRFNIFNFQCNPSGKKTKTFFLSFFCIPLPRTHPWTYPRVSPFYGFLRQSECWHIHGGFRISPGFRVDLILFTSRMKNCYYVNSRRWMNLDPTRINYIVQCICYKRHESLLKKWFSGWRTNRLTDERPRTDKSVNESMTGSRMNILFTC